MAYMRGTYYVYRHIAGGVQIHIGGVVPEADTPEFIEEYHNESSGPGSIRIPLRVMQDLAAKFWLEMPEEQKQRYLTDPHFEPYRIRARKKDQSS